MRKRLRLKLIFLKYKYNSLTKFQREADDVLRGKRCEKISKNEYIKKKLENIYIMIEGGSAMG